jgi:predicted ATP-grasp superfamily ATP-dependent carboligase
MHAVVVIGLCSHGLAMARALYKEGVTVYAIEQNMDLPGVKTRTVDKVFKIADFTDLTLLNELKYIRTQLAYHDQLVLMPTNDNHVRFIGEHLPQLRDLYLISWHRCADNILKLQKKEELEAASRLSGLNYPKSYLIENSFDDLSGLTDFLYPIIIKPAKPMSSFKTEIVYDGEMLQFYLSKYKCDLPILAQEFIQGGDNSIHVAELFLSAGQVIQSITGRKVKSYPPERGQATIVELFDDAEVAAQAARFVAPFHLDGPIGLEFKKDVRGQLWLIEPTVGRTDFFAQVVIAAGVNLPYQEYMLALGKKVPYYQNIQPTVWFDNEREPRSFVETCLQQRTLYPFGKHPTFTYFTPSDMKPFVHGCWCLLKRIVKNLQKHTINH